MEAWKQLTLFSSEPISWGLSGPLPSALEGSESMLSGRGCPFCTAEMQVTREDYIYESVSFQIRPSANRGVRQSRAERQQGEVARVEKRSAMGECHTFCDRMSPRMRGAVVEAARLAHLLNQQQHSPFPTGWPNKLWTTHSPHSFSVSVPIQ